MKKETQISYEYFKNSVELNDIEKELFKRAKEARENAYAPYSNFLVGCSVLLENGEIYSGNNQENAAFFLPVFVRKERPYSGLPLIFLTLK
ncbi:hypothetical protein QF023_001931 [Chryseobacterium sp. SLBN-27]|nr:hypothetical protein [Chryseobacterium sp. SLBN-27]